MNERIRELAKQAGYRADIFGFGHWDMPECKKFVELLVKECAELNFRSTGHVTVDGEIAIGDMIRKHFGIEK